MPDYTNVNTNLNTQRANRNDIRTSSYDLNPTDALSNGLLQTLFGIHLEMLSNFVIYRSADYEGLLTSFFCKVIDITGKKLP